MKLIRGRQNLKLLKGDCVLSIGNYDGLHLGHQKLIRKLLDLARIQQLPATVMTFEPYPQEYFCEASPPSRLTSFRQKLELFRKSGVDQVFCLRFNRELADMPAISFVERYLVGGLRARHIVVGDDFRFGKDRLGGVETLEGMAGIHGFVVTGVGTVRVKGERVSSSRIRACLEHGDLDQAQHLVGRRFSISGCVVLGDQRGRTLGFPTANIIPSYDNVPLKGVFAVMVRGVGNQILRGVANLGHRPTIAGDQLLLEVHFFSFDQEIYGLRIQVEFCHRIRGEQKFDSLEALQIQIRDDIDYATEWFDAQGEL